MPAITIDDFRRYIIETVIVDEFEDDALIEHGHVYDHDFAKRAVAAKTFAELFDVMRQMYLEPEQAIRQFCKFADAESTEPTNEDPERFDGMG